VPIARPNCRGARAQQTQGEDNMKHFLRLSTFVLLLTCVAGAQRLPQVAVPENYRLNFAPDLDKGKFAGEETIKVKLLKPASQIVLNAADLEFQEASITSAGATRKAAITFDKETETATLAVAAR